MYTTSVSLWLRIWDAQVCSLFHIDIVKHQDLNSILALKNAVLQSLIQVGESLELCLEAESTLLSELDTESFTFYTQG